MSAINISGVRAELCKNGYAVLPRFFDEEELDQLRYEAEHMLEASGAYDHGDSESIAASRGCVFEVVRPAYSCLPAALTAPGCSGQEGAWGRNPVLAGGGLASAAPAAHMAMQQAGSSAMRLPGLGLMGCAKLHALVCAALGFPFDVLSQPDLRAGAGARAGARAGTAGFGTPVAGLGDTCGEDADGAKQAAADQVAHGGIAATPDGHACAAVAPGEAAATGGGRHPAVATAGAAACRAGCGCGSGRGGVGVLPPLPSDTSCARAAASAVAAGSVSNTYSGDGGTCGCSCSSRNNGGGRSSSGIGSSSSGINRSSTSSNGAGPYLFNEQFIIKPPRSSARCAFGWHRDSDWCRGRPEFQYSPYISVWAALDDMDAENGALAVVPRSHVAPAGPAAAAAPVASVQGGGAGTDAVACALAGAAPSAATAAAAPHQLLLVPAGTVVVFLDTLLHASGPNTSRHMRRAWMPQFSAEPILRRRQAPPQHQQQELRLLQEPQQTPHRTESLEAQQQPEEQLRHQPHPHGLLAGVLAPDAMRGGRGRPQQQPPAQQPVALAVPLRALAGAS